MSAHDEIFLKATEAGCEPIWSDGLFGVRWHCGCINNRHGCDQQCSAITLNSVNKAKEYSAKI
jgi:hypothetical protein